MACVPRTYTAPADGWVFFSSLNATLLQLYNLSVSGCFSCAVSPTKDVLGIHLPYKKGDIIQIYYNFDSVRWLRFVYAVGSEPTA